MTLRLHGFRVAIVAAVTTLAAVSAQQPMTPDQQAEVLITAGQKAYNEGNFPAADQQFKQVLTKFAGTPQANTARLGIALILVNSPEQNFTAAVEQLTPAANDGNLKDRGSALYTLAVCQRALGIKELEKTPPPADKPEQRVPAADAKFTEAQRRFGEARDWYAGQKMDDKAGRARCDVAEIELRLGRVKEARATCEPFTKDPAFAKNPHRPMGLYYHGLACFLDRDYPNAGRSLNQVAPFDAPGFGNHARYLVGRVLHLSGENAEASVHYDGVIADYEKAKKDATAALQKPETTKNNPAEKLRLETLIKGPAPEYVAASVFYGAALNYEAGKFAEALGKFQAFAKDYPTSPLLPDVTMRTGLCMVQMRQYDEAVKLLLPNVDKTPRLADQTLLWLGKAQLGIAAAADPANLPDKDAKTKAAVETLKKAGERVQQMVAADPDAKVRRPEILFELGDAYQVAKMYKEAAQVYEQLWNEQAMPTRREEVLQRVTASLGAAGELDRSNARCEEFRKQFPQSVLTAAVAFRAAENSYAKAADAIKKKAPADQIKAMLTDSAAKYKEVVEKFAEFEKVNYARLGVGVCLSQLNDLEGAVKVLDAIPAPERAGELATSAYLLADLLIRQAPTKAEDALAENQIREKLTAAAGLLDGFAAGNPKSPEAPLALLKLALCNKRLGATLADANERNQTLNRAREICEKLAKDYPKDPAAAQGTLERAKIKALMGDKGGAMNDLRAFATDPTLQQSPVAPLAALHLATLLREQNQPAEAVKVMLDARAKFDGPLAADPERADWVPLLKYHQAVAVMETAKPNDSKPLTDARTLFEEVIKQAPGKPIAAEAALRSGQCQIGEGKKVEADARPGIAAAGIDAAKRAAAEAVVNKGRAEIALAGETMLRRAEEFKQGLPTAEGRARMYYDAAWAFRGLAEEEVAKAREALQKAEQQKLVEAQQKKLPAGSPPPQVPLPDVDRVLVPSQPSEERAFAAYKRLTEEFADTALAVDARFECAEMRADQGKFDEAVKLLKEALDKEPTDKPVPPETLERVRLRLGAALAAKKDFAAAGGQFDAVAANAKSPYLPHALYRAGECYTSAGEFDKAIEKLKQFRDAAPFQNIGGISDRAMLRLGQALLGSKKYDEARTAFETVIQRFGAGNPFAADARYGAGVALQSAGKFDEAVASYQQVTVATTNEVAAKAQAQIGQCKLAQKKYAEAAAAFLVVPYAYEFPELGYSALLEAARAFAEDGKPAEAERVLTKLAKDAPKGSEWAKAAAERLAGLKK